MENKEFILDQATIKKLLLTYKLMIPDFQRGFVWKKGKKQQLLESLFRGFPIGAITLYEDKNGYYIIDGLQRINTLNEYLSSPSAIISSSEFLEKIEGELQKFLGERGVKTEPKVMKKSIKYWYENLTTLYEYEKVSVLYKVFRQENNEEFEDLQLVEDLLEILKGKIEIVHDDIALIIYKGNKNDLPDLFKNINTGSVALSQYEILQPMWSSYVLDKSILSDTFEAFEDELELIENDYEIKAVKEKGKFDIFKNIVGLNHMICCMEKAELIFSFSGFKKLPVPVVVGNCKKYYANDSIAFEIYSTILSNSSNKIVKTVDSLFQEKNKKGEITDFVKKINDAILESIDIAINRIEQMDCKVIRSKYHSLYIVAGIVFARYEIDVEKLKIMEKEANQRMLAYCLDLDKHVKEKWFVDENRQMGFFNEKILELVEQKEK